MSSNPYPDGWTEMTFGEMAEQVSERVDDPKKAGVEVYVGLEHLDPEDLRIRRRGTPDDVEATKLRVRPGQIIFGKRRAYQRKVAVADFDGIASAHAMILQEKPSLYPGFLPFFMQSDTFMDRAVTISEGGLSPTIKWKTLAAEKFMVPPPEQQRELVELMQGFERAIEAGDEVVHSLRNLQITNARNHFNGLDVEAVKLGSLLSRVQYGSSQATSNEGALPMLRMGNLVEGKIDSNDLKWIDMSEDDAEKYLLKQGDILFNRTNSIDLVGKTSIFDLTGDYVFASYLLRINTKLELLYPEYLNIYMNLPENLSYLRSQAAKAVSQANINPETLKATRIKIDNLNSQMKLILENQQIEVSLNIARTNLAASKELRFSILNSALSPSAMAEAAAEVPA